MATLPSFLRRSTPPPDEVGIEIRVTPSPTLPNLSTHHAAAQAVTRPIDPARRALMSRIALVTVEEDAELPALLPADAPQSTVIQRIMLPRNPRIAGDELYELDGMDLIAVICEQDRVVGKDTLRWLTLLKQLGVPMIVLLPYAPSKRREQERIAQFSEFIGLPVVNVSAENLDEARQQFVITVMRIAPATGLALAANLPDFRSPLTRNLLDTALHDSFQTGKASEHPTIQMNLAHHLYAAYGRNGQQYESQKPAIDTLISVVTHYTSGITRRLPFRNSQRHERFTHALSTLLIGYGVMAHLGTTPPSLRKELLPQIWRLYRASGKPVLK